MGAKHMDTADLAKVLERANRDYHSGNGSELDDDTYDILFEELGRRRRQGRKLIHQPTAVGAPPPPEARNKVTLPFTMGSLDKIKTTSSSDEEQAERALARWKAAFRNDGPYMVSDKLDGISALFVQNQSRDGGGPEQHRKHRMHYHARLFTRGDGRVGQDITHLQGMLKRPLDRLVHDDDMEFAVRGELIMSAVDFRDLLAHKEKKAITTTARNLVSGASTATRHPDPDVLRRTVFVPYAVLHPSGMSHSDQVRFLVRRVGFAPEHVVWHRMFAQLPSVKELSRLLDERRRESPYDVDGLVISSSSSTEKNNRLNPLHTIAFKTRADDNVAETKVLRVSWTVSKDGLLKPVVEFEPVKLGGAVLQRATGFHAAYIREHGIGPGARVLVTRSGDVIPYILQVLSGSRSGGQMPRDEASPGRSWKWQGRDAAMIIDDGSDNKDNDVVDSLRRMDRLRDHPEMGPRLLAYFGQKVGVSGFSDATAERLFRAGIRTPRQLLLYDATEDDLARVPGLGPKSASNLAASILRARADLPCAALMEASGTLGRGFGARRISAFLQRYPDTVTATSTASDDHNVLPSVNNVVAEVPGFSEATATAFLRGLHAYRAFQRDNRIPCTLPSSSAVATTTTDKRGEYPVVAFTGMRDKQLEREVENAGGKVSGTVSRNTHFLVVSSSDETNDATTATTGKHKKASELGVPRITPETLRSEILQQQQTNQNHDDD